MEMEAKRTNENPTAIPFCRKRDEVNRKRNEIRKSQAFPRTGRHAKRNLRLARAGIDGEQTSR